MKKTLKVVAVILIVLFFMSLLLQLIPATVSGEKSKPGEKQQKTNKTKPGQELEVSVVFEPAQVQKDESVQEEEEEEGGSFPPVWAGYREEIGFQRYQREMTSRGAVFFFYNADENEWLKIDFSRQVTVPFDVSQIGTKYGTRPSRIKNEPAIIAQFNQATEYTSEVFLARPAEMESAMEHQLSSALERAGLDTAAVLGFRGHYQCKGSKFQLFITGVSLRDVGMRNFEACINL